MMARNGKLRSFFLFAIPRLNEQIMIRLSNGVAFNGFACYIFYKNLAIELSVSL